MRVDLTNYLDAKISNLGVMSIDSYCVRRRNRSAGNNEKLVTRTREKTSTRENIIMYVIVFSRVCSYDTNVLLTLPSSPSCF